MKCLSTNWLTTDQYGHWSVWSPMPLSLYSKYKGGIKQVAKYSRKCIWYFQILTIFAHAWEGVGVKCRLRVEQAPCLNFEFPCLTWRTPLRVSLTSYLKIIKGKGRVKDWIIICPKYSYNITSFLCMMMISDGAKIWDNSSSVLCPKQNCFCGKSFWHQNKPSLCFSVFVEPRKNGRQKSFDWGNPFH